ncbi:PREDICTED: LOW QUALITY PROTEIN: SEC12-like protein 1 [Tarenaya hassleriana]|uniref:LOW QUALITY PROTEIN: SEC12-like protein 1 n=1 Tax=Tarenaya hassleriana TaxID=28532 RepID=UPI0008FD6144|nr:PREDICTED: LOW QUALITY PROTEIN: SEC12-like protein 1 [Tarenaya hassleriana]
MNTRDVYESGSPKILRVGDGSVRIGHVTCGSWIRRPEKANWVVWALGRAAKGRGSSTSSSAGAVEIFSFDPTTSSLPSSPLVTRTLEESDGDPIAIAVHPCGDNFVCSTSEGGCKLFEVCRGETYQNFLPLEDVGPQKCLVFSFDRCKLAAGGEDGCLRILEWPSLRLILDEPKAHKSFKDMDFSLDSEFLATTPTDGSARIWKADDGFPVATLARNPDENIELCRFSKDGTKPFLFCAAQKGETPVVNVYDICTWKKIGYKKLIRKAASAMAVSLDGKYIALGSKDGDVSVAEIKTMEIYRHSKSLHLGHSIASLEFCPYERVLLTSSVQWGEMVTKLAVPSDWKDWQIYVLLLGLSLVSAVACYIFFKNSDSFRNFPLGKDQRRPKISFFGDPMPSDEQSKWNPFGPVDM